MIVPANEFVAVEDCGRMRRESELAVDEENEALLVVVRVEANAPEDCVNPVIFESTPAEESLCVPLV